MKPFGRVSMSKPLLTSLATVLILLAGATLVQAGSQDFTLVNDTGFDIHELYITPAKSGDWGADVLGVDVLKDRYETYITFSPMVTTKTWDLKIIDEDGSEREWSSLRLNDIYKITLYYKDGEAKAHFN